MNGAAVCKTVHQTAALLDRHKSTVYRMAAAGKLDWCDGRITVESINRWIQDRKGKRKRSSITPRPGPS